MILSVEKLARGSIFLLLASLPFQNISFGFLSVPLFFGAITVGLFVLTLYSRKTLYRTSYIELYSFFYFMAMCFSFTFFNFQIEQSIFPILKTFVYLIIYLATFQLFCVIEDKPAFLIRVAKFGVIFYIIFVCYFAVRAGVGIKDLISFSFYNTTLRIYQEISATFGTGEITTGSSTRRNAVGEALAIYFIIMLGKSNLLFIFGIALMLFLLQSRRAFFVAAAFYAYRSATSTKYILAQIILCIVVIVVFLSTTSLLGEDFSTRLGDLSPGQRTAMFVETLDLINDRPLIGYGFGAKLDGLYVHNIILSSWYMMGVVGLGLSLLLVGELMRLFFTTSHPNFLILLPLASVMVAGTAEGIFTPAGWACIAIVRGFQATSGDSSARGISTANA